MPGRPPRPRAPSTSAATTAMPASAAVAAPARSQRARRPCGSAKTGFSGRLRTGAVFTATASETPCPRGGWALCGGLRVVDQPLRERLAGGGQRSLVGGLQHVLEIEDPLAERVKAVLADDGVRGHAHLARARGRLEDRLAVQRGLVEASLAEDDGERGAGALVVADGVEDERRAGLELGAEGRPQPAREAAAGARHGDAARVAGEPVRGLVHAARLA